MWGVVKDFQIACNLAGPLGDLTGTCGQSSERVVHRDLAGPLGDLTGTGGQSSERVVHRDLAGPLGDLTETGDQSSGEVVHRDLAGPLGDLTETGDQPSGKVVLVISRRTSQGNNQHEQSNKRGRGRSQVGQTGIVKIHITL